MGTWRAILRVAGFVSMTLAIMPVQWVLVRFNLPGSYMLPLYYHRILCKLIGIKVTVKGTPVTDRPVLICANHTSYLDIPVMSTVVLVSATLSTRSYTRCMRWSRPTTFCIP